MMKSGEVVKGHDQVYSGEERQKTGREGTVPNGTKQI